MTRPAGFAIADHDTGFLGDDRVLDAVALVGPSAVVAYVAVRDASWARGERVTLPHALRRLPAAYGLSDVVDPLFDALLRAHLIDDTGRIPEAVWSSWYDPADARREARRESGRIGGVRSGEVRRSKREATLEATLEAKPKQSRSKHEPDRPSDDVTTVTSDGLSTVAREDDATVDDPYTVTGSSTATVYCVDYNAHTSSHARAYAGGPFVCSICGPRPSPSFRDAVASAGGPAW